MANEEPVRQHEQDLAALQRDIALAEARSTLAEARSKLAAAENRIAKERQPWWRSGLTVTTLAAIISAVIPLTAQIQSWKDQALLYRKDLLTVESPEVERLMVSIGQILEKCRPHQCPAIEGLAYQLARQMKAEIRADALPVATPEGTPDAPGRGR